MNMATKTDTAPAAKAPEHISMFDSVMARFDIAASKLDLDQNIINVLKNPLKNVIVSIPVMMDNGKVEVFQGYRIVHSIALGPSKGGIMQWTLISMR